jgi:hypothetical protein
MEPEAERGFQIETLGATKGIVKAGDQQERQVPSQRAKKPAPKINPAPDFFV